MKNPKTRFQVLLPPALWLLSGVVAQFAVIPLVWPASVRHNVKHFRKLLLSLSIILLLTTGASAQAMQQGATYTHVVGGWTFLQNTYSYQANGPDNQCTTGSSSCTLTIFPTTAGSAWFASILTQTNVTITSVTGGGAWTLCPNGGCHVFNPDNDDIDSAYNITGKAGTTSITFNLSGATSGYFDVYFYEVLPPTCGAVACTAEFDSAGTASSSYCTFCAFAALTVSATDAIFHNVDSAWGFTGISSPYYIDYVGNPFTLNAKSGDAPTATQQNGGGYLSDSAIAFKAGTYTAPAAPWSYTYPASRFPYGAFYHNVSCSPSCSVTVQSTGPGHLLFMQSETSTSSRGSIVSVSGGGTWVAPSGYNTCQLSESFGTISCAYVLSSTVGATAVTPTMSSSGTYDFAFYEVVKNPFSMRSSPIALDTQGSSVRSASDQPSGQALTLTGTDVVFQQIYPGGGSPGAGDPASTLHSMPQGGQFMGVGASGMLLNTTNGAAPLWMIVSSPQIAAVSAVAFK